MSDLVPALITGWKDDPDGSLRIYVKKGNSGLHTHLDVEHRNEFRPGPMHNYIPDLPPEALCLCPEPPDTAGAPEGVVGRPRV